MTNPTTAELWDSWSDGYYAKNEATARAVVADPVSAFHRTTWEVIASFLPELKGKQVLVPSSGDNQAAFAFAVLGAQVTSCDISPKQIANAKKLAEQFHLDLRFQVEDTMRLEVIASDTYDLVYMSEGALVWLDDLPGMCRNIRRVLKPGGLYINYEIHPIGRPFKDKFGKLVVGKPYDDIGQGEKNHWRTQDVLNAVCGAGLTLKRLEEMFDEKDKGHFWFYAGKRAKMSQKKIDAYYDWRKNFR